MCADCGAAHWRKVIEDVLDSGSASDSTSNFLSDMDDWIEKNGHATEKQIASIKEKADEAGVDY